MRRRTRGLALLSIFFVFMMFYTNESLLRDLVTQANPAVPDPVQASISLFEHSDTTLAGSSKQYNLPPIVSDRWIVVTSVNYPTEDVKRLASLEGWNLVVVADRKTPKSWYYKNVHFLSMELQDKLGFRLAAVSPENSYTRKNIGYLYAIKNGAKWIYDTDDDNKPYGRGLSQFDYRNTTSGLCYRRSTDNNSTQQKLFNPYRFFGNPEMWPRGFPLEHLRDHTNGKDRLCLCSSLRTPAVQQGLVHKDPDVDAIYRLLYADKKTGLNERFNEFAPPIVLDSGTYSPWNSQNTLFHVNAFFTLFLPVTVAFRVTDIWRSYFAQKLLHVVGERIAFYPVNAIQFRNAHNYMADFQQELDVYTKSGKFIEFLDSWHCESNDISNCTVELAEQLGLLEFWHRKDSFLVKLWIEDLRLMGYEFPNIVHENPESCSNSKNGGSTCNAANIELNTDMPLNHEEKAIMRMKQKLEFAEDLHDWCRKSQPADIFTSFTYNYLAEKHSQHRSLVENLGKVLIVIVDQDGAGLGLLQRIYQPYFAVTIFCGGKNFFKNSGKFNDLLMVQPVNYIALEENIPYAMTVKCLIKVQQMKLQNVTGYYAVSDTVIFQIWNSHGSSNKVIFPSQGRRPNEALWEDAHGSFTSKSVYRLIADKYKNDDDVQKIWRQYQTGLSANGIQRPAADHLQNDVGFADSSTFIYIPSSRIDYFSRLVQLFDEANVPVGFAVAKFLDTVKVEWLPPLANVLNNDGKYTKNLLLANPTRFSEHVKIEERKLYVQVLHYDHCYIQADTSRRMVKTVED